MTARNVIAVEARAALKAAGWSYDWSYDYMFGRGRGWTDSHGWAKGIHVGLKMPEAIIADCRERDGKETAK